MQNFLSGKQIEQIESLCSSNSASENTPAPLKP